MLAEVQLEQYYSDLEALQDMQDELADWPEPQKDEDVTYVLAWSQSEQNRWGDEFAAHYVAIVDYYGEPTGKIYGSMPRSRAEKLAENMGQDRGLPVEFDLFS